MPLLTPKPVESRALTHGDIRRIQKKKKPVVNQTVILHLEFIHSHSLSEYLYQHTKISNLR